MAENNFEPRLTVVERELETLTKDVKEMCKSVRDLTVLVTEVKAPRRVDWFPLFGAVMSAIVLIMAIGSAVIVPLNSEVTALKLANDRQRDRFDLHTVLPLHPVGASRVDALERLSLLLTEQLKQNLDGLDKKLQQLKTDDLHSQEVLAANAKRESELAHLNVTTRVNDLDIRLQKEFGLTQERNNARLAKLESSDTTTLAAIMQELRDLREWRQKAVEKKVLK